MIDEQKNIKSNHFTATVRRQFALPPEKVFAAWVDPETRMQVLLNNRYKKGVKEINIIEGGHERYEDRWKNTLYSTTTRKYVTIRQSKMIVCHVETVMPVEGFDQVFAKQELMLFNAHEKGTEVVASSQCASVEPYFVHAVKDSWNELFRLFEQCMTEYWKSRA